MASEMFSEAVELITMAVDKHAISKNYEAAAGMIKVCKNKPETVAFDNLIISSAGYKAHEHFILPCPQLVLEYV